MCKVAFIGYGVVGSGTVELFMKNRESISKKVCKWRIREIPQIKNVLDVTFLADLF